MPSTAQTLPADDHVMRAVIENRRSKRRKGFKTSGQDRHDISKARAAVDEFVVWMRSQSVQA